MRFGLAALASLGLFQFFGCRTSSKWRPYERPEGGIQATDLQLAADGTYTEDG
ncbi:MAG: hypothetical protein JNL12_19775, partial [Planctomycetes bacterium]|nr:hypothetical protein [Planctomycetota bacterium]